MAFLTGLGSSFHVSITIAKSGGGDVSSCSEAFLCERSAGRRLQIAFKIECSLSVHKCSSRLDVPRPVLGGVWTLAGIVSIESLIEVLREAGVETAGMLLRLQNIDVVEVLVVIHGVPSRSFARPLYVYTPAFVTLGRDFGAAAFASSLRCEAKAGGGGGNRTRVQRYVSLRVYVHIWRFEGSLGWSPASGIRYFARPTRFRLAATGRCSSASPHCDVRQHPRGQQMRGRDR